MKLTLQPLDSPKELKQFQENTAVQVYAKFYHSWEWGEFQSSLGKRIFRLGLRIGTELVGTALLIEESGRFGPYLYCPRGPLINYADTELVKAALTALIDYGRNLSGMAFLRLDPAIVAQDPQTRLLASLGFKPAARWFVQVGRAWVCDIGGKNDDQLLQWLSQHGMRSNVPRYLRKASRAGLTVRASADMADLELFLEMLGGLDKRKGGIGTFAPDYYRKQFAAMAASGQERIFVAELDGQALASALVAVAGQEASYLHGASSDQQRDLHAPQFMHIEIMKYARDHGCSKYNFWGVVGDNNFHPGHYGYGYSAFKKSFGGYIELYMPVQDYVFRPLPYRLTWLKEKQHMLRHHID